MRKALISGYSIFLWLIDTIYLLAHKPSSDKAPLVLLVRLDNIGDFILWLSSVKKIQKKYKDKVLVLVANKSFAELARDTGYFDHVVSVDVHKFILNIFYRWMTLTKITKLNVEVAIQPNYSRSFLAADSFIRISNATDRIGSTSDLNNITAWQRVVSNRWYTHLIYASSKPLMELERDAEFLLGLGVENKGVHVAQLPVLTKLTEKLNIDGNYFIIFPGASWSGRKWPNKSFAEVGKYISEQYGYKMVICGVQSEYQDAESIISHSLVSDVINLVGKTTLSQFCELVRGAKLLIGNETSAIHIAAATNTQSVCLLGGGHFSRFAPYSNVVMGMKPIVVFSKMECYNCNWKCIQTRNANSPVLCINNISVQMVIEKSGLCT